MDTLFFSSSPLFAQSAEGITDRLIAYGQTGRVKYRGTYWFAQLYEPDRQTVIPAGKPVQVVAIRGITLLVTPAIS